MMRRTLMLWIGLAAAWLSGNAASARDLGIEERVAAQAAIERVYHRHRIGTAIPFEAAMPRAVLEQKVSRYLRQSVALEEFWATPITTEMLEREVERISRETRMPERLRELFDALGGDSFLVQECLARPVLVERLARAAFARDERIHGYPRREVEDLLAPQPIWDSWWEKNGPRFDASRARTVAQTDAVLPDLASTAEATLCPPEDTWVSYLDNFPRGRPEFTAVWTGNEMIVWGGGYGGNYLNTGGRYDPVLDRWVTTTTVGAPSPRQGHTAVWTGTEMIVWGGHQGSSYLSTGARYDPLTDRWSPTPPTLGAPANRTHHTAVWTGTEMIVWGGHNGGPRLSTGARYLPASNQWVEMVFGVATPAGRAEHTAVWTGREMIVWGGADLYSGPFQTGGRYDTRTDTWHPTALDSAPIAGASHTAIWTGDEMIVWSRDGGGRYEPATDTWRPVTNDGAPSARSLHTAVWTGSTMLVWGGSAVGMYYADSGGSYDPATDTWEPTAADGAPMGRSGHSAVWTGHEMIVWGGIGGGFNFDSLNTGGRYDPVTNRWTPTRAPLSGREGHTAVWTGSEMLLWGGRDIPVGLRDTGARYDPATDTTVPLSTTGAPEPREGHTAVWTGGEMIVWGGTGEGFRVLASGSRYDPVLDTWAQTSDAFAPVPRYQHTAVWTGSEMIVWGGLGAGGYLDSGGRYDPLLDAWMPTSMEGAPRRTDGHTATWTGSEMIVWGGRWAIGGERYDPAQDRWLPMAAAGAPTRRTDHTAVWTGEALVVWGGCTWVSTPDWPICEFHATGGRYDPAIDAWTPTSLNGSASARAGHIAVWTGKNMIVWGGGGGGSGLSGAGRRYDPVTDAWTSMTTSGAPPVRWDTTAVWTGRAMIVWGGGPGLRLDSGGIYYGTVDADLDGLDDACESDLDGDGIDNDSDCAPADPDNLTAAVGDSLRLTNGLGATLLSWLDDGVPGPFSVYRGVRSPGMAWGYDQECVDPVVEDMFWEDGLAPAPGALFYYLVARVGPCGESALGFDTRRHETPNAAPCPDAAAP